MNKTKRRNELAKENYRSKYRDLCIARKSIIETLIKIEEQEEK